MPETRYDDLRALFLSCTLKRSPEPSNTEGLVEVSRRIPEKQASSANCSRILRLSRGYRSSCWRWQVVRRLAASRAPAAEQPAIGTPITGPDQLACSHGDRRHLVGAWDTFR